MDINKEILKTLKYFSYFAYYPTLKEIHTFLQVKISQNELKKELKRIKYTPPQYSIRRKISKRKLQNWRYRTYIKLVSLFPQIKLVGLSGSISMMNAEEKDDIDLFIITAKNRLFTGRLIALIIAQLLGLRRFRDSETQFFHKTNKSEKITFSSSHRDKVCLNLFFDESNLKVPKFKQTEFVGHEVLQMKPLISKDRIYERFLEVNGWVFRLFPNAKEDFHGSKADLRRYQQESVNSPWKSINNKIEQMLKRFQLNLINRHRTTEIITSSQLWFHPDDFGEKTKN